MSLSQKPIGLLSAISRNLKKKSFEEWQFFQKMDLLRIINLDLEAKIQMNMDCSINIFHHIHNMGGKSSAQRERFFTQCLPIAKVQFS